MSQRHSPRDSTPHSRPRGAPGTSARDSAEASAGPSAPSRPAVPDRRVPPHHNRTLGARGEAFASRFLIAHGFTPVARNWRCRYGELDLIMRDGETLVAVEVKTRSDTRFGSPLWAITPRKAARLRRLLFEWARSSGHTGRPLRVDAVGITARPGAAPHVEHLRGIS